MSVDETDFNFRTSKVASSPKTSESLVEIEESRSSECEPSVVVVEDSDDRRRDDAAAENGQQLTQPEDADGVPDFTYMNAADVAEVVQGRGAGNGGDDVVPGSESTSVDTDAAENHQDVSAENEENKSADVRHASGETPESSPPAPRSDEVAEESLPATDPATMAAEATNPAAVDSDSVAGPAGEKSDADREKPVRSVTLRRDLRKIVPSRSSTELPPAPATAPVIMLHVNMDFEPTAFADLDHLSTDAGSAVEKLKLSLEKDDSSGDCSSHSIPRAVQPGKAFDSLKYFLSTLD